MQCAAGTLPPSPLSESQNLTTAIQTVKSEAGGLIGAPYFGEQWRCVEVAADGLSSDRLTTLHFEPPPASGP